MTIVMIPDYTGTNPHQSLLKKELEQRGAKVILAASLRQGWRACQSFAGPTVLHLHWEDRELRGKTRVGFGVSLIRFFFFLGLFRWKQVPIVWTFHNTLPHEASFLRLEKAAR